MTDRTNLLLLLNAARSAGRQDYVRHVAADWLAIWPGDREVTCLMANSELELGFADLAAGRFAGLIEADPEDPQPYVALASITRAKGDVARAVNLQACASALQGLAPPPDAPGWTQSLAAALRHLAEQDGLSAQAAAHEVLAADPDLPLPTLATLKAALLQSDHAQAHSLAQIGGARWPHCVAFQLIAALDMLNQGKPADGVEQLHQAASSDPTGSLARRYLGEAHPYHSLWPSVMTAPLSRPVPADVAAVLGGNQLTAAPPVGEPQDPAKGALAVGIATAAVSQAVPAYHATVTDAEAVPAGPAPQEATSIPEPEAWEGFQGPDSGDHPAQTEFQEVRQEFARLSARLGAQPSQSDRERRAPVYVIVANKTRLMQEFGRDTFRRVDEALDDLASAARKRRGWTAIRLYLDDPSSLRTYGLTPAEPSNSWQLKLRIADLDRVLGRRKQMIGALLIVGGPRLFPMHDLPNPTDDDDTVVPSDNPYSTTDENYFVPEWPVGRLPSDADADLLVRMIRRAADHHLAAGQPEGILASLRRWLQANLGGMFRPRLRAFGYSASIWRRASMAVYKAIGEPQDLVTSPPAAAGTMPAQAARPTRLSYFNLHGVEDSPEWFGQRDPLADENAIVEFPIALRPQDVVNGGRAPAVVFSEACYGAHVHGKDVDTALSLKFLASGSQGVIGSTKISYGSVTTPLIAADLLGRLFWDQLNGGLPAGEALRRAKLSLASEMLRRQGYLDGEDQKTIISFVLYGDPLFSVDPATSSLNAKSVARRRHRPALPTIACALGGACTPIESLDSDSVAKVRAVVAQYLPGMADATSKVHPQRCSCASEDHVCMAHGPRAKAGSHSPAATTVVTLSKQVQDGAIRHSHFARLTLDPSGRILKLAVSR